MHSVVETRPFLRAAERLALTEGDRFALVTLLALDPEAGEVIRNTGGLRKLRFAGRFGGKRGGYRV